MLMPTFLTAAEELIKNPTEGQGLWNALDTGHRVREEIRRYRSMTEATQLAWATGYVRQHNSDLFNRSANSFEDCAGETSTAMIIATHAGGMLVGGELHSMPEIKLSLAGDPVGLAILATACLFRDGKGSNKIFAEAGLRFKRDGLSYDPLAVHDMQLVADYTSYHKVKKIWQEFDLIWEPQAALDSKIVNRARNVSANLVEVVASSMRGLGHISSSVDGVLWSVSC